MERPAGGFGRFEGGQTAALNALKNRRLGRVAARVAVERPAGGLEGFKGGQTAGLNTLKNILRELLGKACGRVSRV